MLLDAIYGSRGFLDIIIGLCVSIFVVFCTMPVHEFAHAWTAQKLGDDTARLQGRLTLRPMAHIDIMGAVMIFLLGIGYAKPVPVNPRNFKNERGNGFDFSCRTCFQLANGNILYIIPVYCRCVRRRVGYSSVRRRFLRFSRYD